jgi:hypothetical protein
MLFGHEWHIFDNETRQLVIVFIATFRTISLLTSYEDFQFET